MKIHLHYQSHFNMLKVGKYTVDISTHNSFIELSSHSKFQVVLEVGLDDVRIIDRDQTRKETT
jgi:hypothetical protein